MLLYHYLVQFDREYLKISSFNLTNVTSTDTLMYLYNIFETLFSAYMHIHTKCMNYSTETDIQLIRLKKLVHVENVINDIIMSLSEEEYNKYLQMM